MHTHKTERGGSPLGAAGLRAMRESLTLSYAAIWWLETSGLMPAGYYSNITTRTEYAD